MVERGHVQLLDPPQALRLCRHRQTATGNDVRDQEHVGAVGVELEPLGDVLAEHGRGERPERFPELDLQVHHRLHRRRSRVTDDRAAAKGPRPEFHPALEQADDLFVGEQGRDQLGELGRRELRCDNPAFVEEALDLVGRVARSEIRAAHAVGEWRRCTGLAPCRRPLPGARRLGAHPRLIEMAVPDVQRHADGSTCVAGGRLDPDLVEDLLAENPAVADAVQRDAARQAQVAEPGPLPRVARHLQHGLFGDVLDRSREIHFALRSAGSRVLSAVHQTGARRHSRSS